MAMEDITSRLLKKKLKVKNALSELNVEILTSLDFLQHLKEHCNKIVRNLNSINMPADYFKEFVNVNSCILKSLSVLTEINIKFEMLEIFEDKSKNLDSVFDNASNSKRAPFFNESHKPLTIHENIKNKKGSVTLTDTEINKLGASKKKKKSSKNFKKIQCKNDAVNNKNNNGDVQINEPDLKSNLEEKLDCFSSSISPNVSDLEVAKVKAKKNLNVCVNMSDIKVSQRPIGQSNKGKIQEIPCVNVPSSKLIDSAHMLTCEVQSSQNKSQLPNGCIPVAEVIPTKVNQCSYISETPKKIQGTDGKDLIKTSWTKDEECENKTDIIKPVYVSTEVDNEYEVMIEHIQSPSEFYVYIINSQLNLFSELVQKLKLIHLVKTEVLEKTNENKKACLRKQYGSYALYYSKCDEMWCRVKIINWWLNYKDDYVCVFLLDYGESKCVTVDDLMPMPEYIKKYPAFTRRCHLYGVFPSHLDMDTETLSWGKESTEKMKTLTETSKKLKIKIAPKDDFHPAESLPVKLWLCDQDNECVNELLVKSKFAIYGSCFEPTVIKNEKQDEPDMENEKLNSWNPMKEDFESYENSYDLNINDPAMYIYGYVGKDYKRVCKHFVKTGYCFKGQACKKEHKKLDYLGFTTDQEEVYKNTFNDLPVPPPNSVVTVQVTCLLGINQFCCIQENRNWSPDEENLHTLLKFMNRADNIQEMKKLLIPPSAGQIVIAQYSHDHSWYRAKILESQPENDLYVVLFVDYGNKESLSISHLRAIEARYLHLPFQAVQCLIFGIEQNPEVPVKEAMVYLHKMISSEYINIEVISKLPGEEISLLVHVFDKNGKNIGADLIAKNYAVHKEEMIVNTNSESVPG